MDQTPVNTTTMLTPEDGGAPLAPVAARAIRAPRAKRPLEASSDAELEESGDVDESGTSEMRGTTWFAQQLDEAEEENRVSVSASPDAVRSGAGPSEREAATDVNDEEASLALAMRLMEEESRMRYHEWQQASVMATLEMRGQSELDEDALAALRLMEEEMREAGAAGAVAEGEEESAEAAAQAAAALQAAREEHHGEDLEGEDGEEEEGNDYDALLELGRQMGDVRTERWKTKSESIISKLPITKYIEKPKDGETTTASEDEEMCCICRCEYEADEEIATLPCGHEYHKDCVAHWLTDHWQCPICKFDLSEKKKKKSISKDQESTPPQDPLLSAGSSVPPPPPQSISSGGGSAPPPQSISSGGGAPPSQSISSGGGAPTSSPRNEQSAESPAAPARAQQRPSRRRPRPRRL